MAIDRVFHPDCIEPNCAIRATCSACFWLEHVNTSAIESIAKRMLARLQSADREDVLQEFALRILRKSNLEEKVRECVVGFIISGLRNVRAAALSAIAKRLDNEIGGQSVELVPGDSGDPLVELIDRENSDERGSQALIAKKDPETAAAAAYSERPHGSKTPGASKQEAAAIRQREFRRRKKIAAGVVREESQRRACL